METDATILCQRVLERCQQQRWYAGDLDNTHRLSELDRRYERFYDAAGNEIVIDNDPDDHPRKTSFAYPPATEEQLFATEQSLGFPLSPLLRMLYAQLANGGFGPGHGLIGALDGFCEAGDLVENYQFQVQCSDLIELEEYEQQGEPVELPDTVWPRSLLYLCDWGWGAASSIDSKTGRIYLRLPGERKLHYRLQQQAHSLEEWLEQWLSGELKYQPSWPDEPELDTFSVRPLFEAHSTGEVDDNKD